MISVLVTEENSDRFLPVLNRETLVNSDVFIGAVDEETDTACGILTAEAVDDNVLAINFIYVDEAFRRKGAGKKMVSLLQEFAGSGGISSIVCLRNMEGNDDSVVALLTECGFIMDMSAGAELCSLRISELIDPSNAKFKGSVSSIKETGEKQLKEAVKKWRKTPAGKSEEFGSIFFSEDIDGDLSFIASDEKGSPCAVFLTDSDDNECRIAAFRPADEKQERAALAILEKFVPKAREKYREDARLVAAIRSAGQFGLFSRVTRGDVTFEGQSALMTCDLDL